MIKNRSKYRFLCRVLISMSWGAIILIPVVSSASSTNPGLEIEWETFFGRHDINDHAKDMIQTMDGGFTVLIGSEDVVTEKGNSSLVKFTANGQQVWNTSFWEMWFSGDSAFVQTADGGYVIADRDNWLNDGNWEIFLHKRDSLGQHVWNSTFGGELSEWARSIALTKDGGFVVVGATNYDSSSDTWWEWDMWLVKTNSLGVPEWNSTFDGPLVGDSDTGLSVIPTIDGGYAVLGDTGSQSTNEWYTWLVKTDANGVEEWNHTLEGAFTSILQIADGSFVIAGDTHSFGAGGTDFWLLKTDVNGQEIWNTTYGTPGNEELGAFIQTNDGGFLLAGVVDTLTSDLDIWLVKTDANGQQKWDTKLGGSREDTVSSVVQVSTNTFVIAGSTQPAGTDNRDMWLLQVKVSEDIGTTTAGGPGFEIEILVLSLSLIFVFSRKRRR